MYQSTAILLQGYAASHTERKLQPFDILRYACSSFPRCRLASPPLLLPTYAKGWHIWEDRYETRRRSVSARGGVSWSSSITEPTPVVTRMCDHLKSIVNTSRSGGNVMNYPGSPVCPIKRGCAISPPHIILRVVLATKLPTSQ
jgi:hypothetical protein